MVYFPLSQIQTQTLLGNLVGGYVEESLLEPEKKVLGMT